MTLRHKTLITVGLTLAVMIGALYLVSKTVMLSSFADLEARDTRQNVQRVVNALDDEISALNEKSSDWAVWDDTYEFIETGDPEYVQSNLLDRTFSDLRLNVMLFVNSSGEVVFGKSFDLDQGQEVPVPESLLAHLSPDDLLLQHSGPDDSRMGIVLLPEGPLMVSSRPIVTSEGKGPIRGTLITGRYLSLDEIKGLADKTKTSVTAWLDGSPDMPADSRTARADLSEKQPIAVRPLDDATVAGYTLVADLYGKPALLLRADLPRAIYQQGQASLRYLIGSIVVVGLLFGLVALLLLEKTVLARLARLSVDLRSIGESQDHSARVSMAGSDELASLAVVTNGMLEALEQAQREQRASEERYRAFVERSSEAIWRMELREPIPVTLPEDEQVKRLLRDSRLAECNDEMARVCGYASARDAVGASLERLLWNSGAKGVELIRQFVDSGYRVDGAEFEGAGTPDAPRHFLLNQIGMVEEGFLVRTWGTLRDVTERHLAEEALRQSRQQVVKILEILESISDPFVAVDHQWALTYMNPGARTLLRGGSEQSLLGENLWSLLPESEGSSLRQECQRAVIEQSPAQSELFYPSLERWFAVSVYPFPGGVSVHFRDISDRKRLEEQLLRAHRLETAGRIAGQVAHDFNNLLGPMSAYPELIKMQLPADHPAIQYCDDMLQAAERMAYINEEMMTLGRRGRVEQQPTDLNGVVQQAVEEMAERPETLRLQLDLAPDLPPVSAAAAQLVRVISNLLGNARDAMQGVGTITLGTESVTVTEVPDTQPSREAGAYLRLSVTDTGCGIAPEIRDKIFEAFFTTKDRTRRRGCGLGLSIVQAIVEDHKGFMELESELGKGTTFRVYLPVSRNVVHDEKPRDWMAGGSERVLVVDDDRLQREVARELLETLGYKVEVASSGEEAIEYLKIRPADLLVLDMVLEPGADGSETYRRALQIRPKQRAILVSGFAESDQVREALALGAGSYHRKPMTLEKLAKAVREELDRQN